MIPLKYSSINRRTIHDLREAKNAVNPTKAVGFFNELELNPLGVVDHVSVVLLSNSECPLACTMCDLWKHTLDFPTPKGANHAQILEAQKSLPPADRIKLYNAGNFFDHRAIPEQEIKDIAKLVQDYSQVIIENHPKIRIELAPRFKELIQGNLEVAMGLETVHPQIFSFLNKGMEIGDFRRASTYLAGEDISVRAFIITGLPFLDQKENEKWTLESVYYAFESGASVCSIIPLRTESGVMKSLSEEGHIQKPSLESIESILDASQALNLGRVFLDHWDLRGSNEIIERLKKKNQQQPR